jgi:protein-S-isoprenylcysteine O-methyltransferase Ste14
MFYIHRHLIPCLWLAWLIYWLASAKNVKRTARRESTVSGLSHKLPLMAAVFLFAWPERGQHRLFEPFWQRTEFTFWLGVALLLAGFGITIWARRILGRNWSGTVTIKENHELIQSGPYGFVRHPIYTGLLLAFFGSAVSLGEWRGLLAFVLVLIAFRIKLGIEERWMTELFGPAYAEYRKRVRMLVPFVW